MMKINTITPGGFYFPTFGFFQMFTQVSLRICGFWMILLSLFGGNLAFGATTTQITKNGITWNFSEAEEYGQFVNGDYWVVGPVTVSSVSPAWDGSKNGSMVNPDTTSGDQSYRTGIIFPFNSSTRTTFPVTLDPSGGIKSLVSTEGLATIISGGSKSGVSKASVLTVVSSAPASGSFRPPYVAGVKPIRNVSEINYSLVPTLSLPSGASLPDLSTTLKEVWIQHGNKRAQPSTTFIPNDNVPGYPRDAAKEVSDISLAMMVDSTNRNEYIHRLIQVGIDAYYIHLDNNDAWRAYGGFGSGRKWPILFAGIMLNDNNFKNPIYLTPADQSLTGMVNKFGEDGDTSYGEPSTLYPEGRPIFGQDCISGQYANYLSTSNGSKDCRDPEGLNPNGGGGYRTCCTSLTWVGYALAARLMDGMSIWDHDAFFDYVDWWVEVDTSTHSAGTFPSDFVEDMWNEYRDGSIPSVVVAPEFSPAAGSYSSTQAVSISSATSGSTIRYTTDGSEPTTTTGTVYTSAVSLSSDTTLKAIAYKSGMTASAVTNGDYQIGAIVAAPTFSPGAGSYSSTQTVSMSTATSGATIRYTTNGNNPSSTSGNLYTGAVSISETTTLKAIAYKSGSLDSAVTTGLYSINASGTVTAGAGQGFFNTSMTEQGDLFIVTFSATPSASPTDCVIGLSDGSASAYADLAVIARFNPSGYIDARNGGSYQADNSISYQASSTYDFRLEVDVGSNVYSAYVTPPGGVEQVIGSGYSFRLEQSSVTSLDTWSVQVDATATGTSATVSDVVIASGLDTEAPSVPTGLTASNITDTSVDLDWDLSTDNIEVVGYNIYTNGANPPISLIGNGATVSGLLAGTNYTFAVSAYDEANNESGQSTSVSITTTSSLGTYEIASDAGDRVVYDDDTLWNVTHDHHRVGKGDANKDYSAAVIPFQLPEVGTVTEASFKAYLYKITGSPANNVDLYGLPYRSSSTVLTSDFYEGSYGYDTNGTAIEDDLSTPSSSLGWAITSSGTAEANLVAYLNAQISAGAQAGDWVFIRLSPDSSSGSGTRYFAFRSADYSDASERPLLTITIGDTEAPSVPTGLTATNITETSVDLDWNSSTDNVEVAGYKIYTNGANPVSLTGNSATVTGLSAGTTYTFTVSAYDDADNESAESSSVEITTNATYEIDADAGDRVIYDDGVMWSATHDHHRVGKGASSKDYSAAVIPFQLPAVGTVTEASFKAYLYTLTGSPANNVDLYGLPYRSSSTVLSSDFYEGSYGSDTNATEIANDFSTPTSSLGWAITSSGTVEANLIAYLNAQISAGAEAGDWVFIRLSPDTSSGSGTRYFGFRSADYSTASERPLLTITLSE